MYETLLRPYEVASVSLPTVDSAISKLRRAEVVGEERRLRQKESARIRNKRKRDEAARVGSAEEDETLDPEDQMPPPPKKRKEAQSNDVDSPPMMEEGELEDVTPQDEPGPSATNVGLEKLSHRSSDQAGGLPSSQTTRTLQVAHPFAEVRGHTSYLTFAVLLPYRHITKTRAASASAQEPPSSAGVISHTGVSVGDVTVTTDAPTDFSAYDEYFKSIPDDVSRAHRVLRLKD